MVLDVKSVVYKTVIERIGSVVGGISIIKIPAKKISVGRVIRNSNIQLGTASCIGSREVSNRIRKNANGLSIGVGTPKRRSSNELHIMYELIGGIVDKEFRGVNRGSGIAIIKVPPKVIGANGGVKEIHTYRRTPHGIAGEIGHHVGKYTHDFLGAVRAVKTV